MKQTTDHELLLSLQNEVKALKASVQSSGSNAINLMFPVGSIYLCAEDNDICPLEKLGVGKWEKIADDRVLQGSSNSHPAGELLEAALPDHTHTVTDSHVTTSGYTGAVGVSSIGLWLPTSTTRTTSAASKNNSIYGTDNTVQPPALVVSVWKRVA